MPDGDDFALLDEDAEAGLATVFERHRDRLRRLVGVRLDRRVAGRVDASDIIQETYVEAARRLPEYRTNADVPPFVWVRFLTLQQVQMHHRRHLGTKARDARREAAPPRPEASSVLLAEALAGGGQTPSRVVSAAEERQSLEEALASLEPADRDILSLRHYERLTNAEAAAELGLSEAAASKRYVRALARLERAARGETRKP